MVNSINLTMSNKDQIATWKANRRKLVRVDWPPIPNPSDSFSSGLFNGWYSRLHCTGDIFAKGILERVVSADLTVFVD